MANGWGGARPNSGPRKSRDASPRRAAGSRLAPEPKLSTQPAPANWSATLQHLASTMESARFDRAARPFAVAAHPPAATPPSRQHRMAMDESLSWAAAQVSGIGLLGAYAEGVTFLGYPYLAQLAQRPEYRIICETIATEATRKWIKLRATGDDPDADEDDRAKSPKAGKIKAIEAEMERLEVRDRFADVAAQDGFFGRAHLYLDYGHDIDSQADELAMSIGDGWGARSRGKITKGMILRSVRTIEAVWCYPLQYNAANPLKPNWYNPQIWYVMGTSVHVSRLLPFVARPVPDMLKPAYSFGGVALSQLAQPYVDIWLKTRQSIGELIHAFSVMVLKTDLSTLMQPGQADGLLTRAAGFNAMRDNQGLMVVNKNTEDFANVSTPLGGLHELQAQSQEHMASVARIPLVKFTGISPSGLNASSEGEMRAFYDTIAAYQNKFMRPNLSRVINFIQLGLFGEVDPEITYDFVPLWELTEKERAEKRKTDAETAQIHIDSGVLSPEEERARIAADPESPYHGLDPDAAPDLLEEEQQGLEPEGGRPQPVAEGQRPDSGLSEDYEAS